MASLTRTPWISKHIKFAEFLCRNGNHTNINSSQTQGNIPSIYNYTNISQDIAKSSETTRARARTDDIH